MSPPMQRVSPGHRALNVKDALSYLELVKVKPEFSDQPDIYNRFLDIMKDFRSQAWKLKFPQDSLQGDIA